MNLTKWLKDRKIFRLKQELAALEQNLKTWEPYIEQPDPDGVPVFIIQKVANFRARIAQIKEELK